MAPRVFQRHAGMAADRELELDDRGCAAKHRIDVAVALPDHGRLRCCGRARIRPARRSASSSGGSSSISSVDEIGRVFGDIGIVGEHGGDRLADIAHLSMRQHRLAIRLERRNPSLAEIDRRHVGDIGRGPDRDDAGQRARRRRIDRDDPAMRVVRANDPHVELVRK